MVVQHGVFKKRVLVSRSSTSVSFSQQHRCTPEQHLLATIAATLSWPGAPCRIGKTFRDLTATHHTHALDASNLQRTTRKREVTLKIHRPHFRGHLFCLIALAWVYSGAFILRLHTPWYTRSLSRALCPSFVLVAGFFNLPVQ